MITRFRFLHTKQRFQYKNTIFEKISKGFAKCIYVSANYKKDQKIRLPSNTWISYKEPKTNHQLKLF